MQPEVLPTRASELLQIDPAVTAGHDLCLWRDQATVDLIWRRGDGDDDTWDARLVVMPRARGAVTGIEGLQVKLEGPGEAGPDLERPGHWAFRGLPAGEYHVRVQPQLGLVGGMQGVPASEPPTQQRDADVAKITSEGSLALAAASAKVGVAPRSEAVVKSGGLRGLRVVRSESKHRNQLAEIIADPAAMDCAPEAAALLHVTIHYRTADKDPDAGFVLLCPATGSAAHSIELNLGCDEPGDEYGVELIEFELKTVTWVEVVQDPERSLMGEATSQGAVDQFEAICKAADDLVKNIEKASIWPMEQVRRTIRSPFGTVFGARDDEEADDDQDQEYAELAGRELDEADGDHAGGVGRGLADDDMAALRFELVFWLRNALLSGTADIGLLWEKSAEGLRETIRRLLSDYPEEGLKEVAQRAVQDHREHDSSIGRAYVRSEVARLAPCLFDYRIPNDVRFAVAIGTSLSGGPAFSLKGHTHSGVHALRNFVHHALVGAPRGLRLQHFPRKAFLRSPVSFLFQADGIAREVSWGTVVCTDCGQRETWGRMTCQCGGRTAHCFEPQLWLIHYATLQRCREVVVDGRQAWVHDDELGLPDLTNVEVLLPPRGSNPTPEDIAMAPEELRELQEEHERVLSACHEAAVRERWPAQRAAVRQRRARRPCGRSVWARTRTGPNPDAPNVHYPAVALALIGWPLDSPPDPYEDIGKRALDEFGERMLQPVTRTQDDIDYMNDHLETLAGQLKYPAEQQQQLTPLTRVNERQVRFVIRKWMKAELGMGQEQANAA